MTPLQIQMAVFHHWEEAPGQTSLRYHWWQMHRELETLNERNRESYTFNQAVNLNLVMNADEKLVITETLKLLQSPLAEADIIELYRLDPVSLWDIRTVDIEEQCDDDKLRQLYALVSKNIHTHITDLHSPLNGLNWRINRVYLERFDPNFKV